MKIARGCDLAEEDQKFVLNTFRHRMTSESIERWPRIAAARFDHGFKQEDVTTDAEWLSINCFYIRKNGQLDRRFLHPVQEKEKSNVG